MYPPVFATLAATPAVTALIGTSPVRCYPAGEAPQGVVSPYVTWQVIAGSPENYLSGSPDTDIFACQLDVWGATLSSVHSVAEAVRDALEAVAYVVAWRGETKDAETNRYRYSFDVEFLTPR